MWDMLRKIRHGTYYAANSLLGTHLPQPPHTQQNTSSRFTQVYFIFIFLWCLPLSSLVQTAAESHTQNLSIRRPQLLTKQNHPWRNRDKPCPDVCCCFVSHLRLQTQVLWIGRRNTLQSKKKLQLVTVVIIQVASPCSTHWRSKRPEETVGPASRAQTNPSREVSYNIGATAAMSSSFLADSWIL